MERTRTTLRRSRARLLPLLLALPFAACEETGDPLSPAAGLAAGKGGTPKPAMIAYVGIDRQIRLIAPDGTNDRQLTTPAAWESDSDPDFVPGNRTLVFTRASNASGAPSSLRLEPTVGG